MKRRFALLLAAALLASLCGCGDYVSLMPGGESVLAEAEEAEFSAKTLGELLGWQDFMASYYDDTPVALAFTGAQGYASPVFDRESIIKACDALRSITVTDALGEAPEGTAADACYGFTMADGEAREIEFAGGDLLYRGQLYAVSGGEALESLSFPGYGDGWTVFDLYFDSKIADFAAAFADNTPVSVGRRANGGAILSSQDEAVIREVFDLFASAQIESVEESPDRNIDLNSTQDYVFTMADGSTMTFTVTGGCLAVQKSGVYGTVYYHFSNSEALSEMTIATGAMTTAFEGGALADLRNDIGRAIRAANGEYVAPENEADVLDQTTRDTQEEETESSGGLSVVGVYVSFVIGGTQDYISVTGEDAEEFVRLMGQIEVSNEHLTAAPEGDQFTVSVNLSDWSGPICYFGGGAAQQTVGNWYVCSSGYDALRSRIWEIYQQQLTERDIEGTNE